MYWLKRLHEIQEEAKDANEKRMEELATDAISQMSTVIKDRNFGILRANQNGWDALREDTHLVCLKE